MTTLDKIIVKTQKIIYTIYIYDGKEEAKKAILLIMRCVYGKR